MPHRSRISEENAFSYLGTSLDSVSLARDLAAAFEEAACSAGKLALAFYRPGAATSAEVSHKAEGSPVTEADYLVDQFLRHRLGQLLPDAGWLSEETEDSSARLSKEQVLIVDPIDGTRGFMRGQEGWAISVALIEHGRPLAGIIHAPALKETYVAVRGAGARLNGSAITVSKLAALRAGARIAAPGFLAERLRQTGINFKLQPRIPSLALRIANVASGAFDAGFASENARDWDIAAADIILHEAGGRLAALDGREVLYNRADTRHGPLTAAPEQIHAEVNAAALLVNVRSRS
ncbi:MAG: 3'(2'),5'-bisphosphate nucleotidase CysQ [Beijerinckiaceae bacterium]|nr:3'(2'),5'-bisphosphate nucleotidase CysQ [Beijerinckiaceae bacterium]